MASVVLLGCSKNEPADSGKEKDPGKTETVLKVDQTPITVDCLGDIINVNVECNVANTAEVLYDADAEETWISLSTTKLSGNGTYTLTIGEYESPLAARNAELVIKAGDKSATIQITQTPKETVSLAHEAIVGIDAERTYSVEVTTNAKWKAETSDSWITIVKGEGDAGTSKLQIKLAAIGDAARRDGSVVVTSGSTGAILKVSQGYGMLIGGLIWAKYNLDEPGTFVDNPEKIGKVYCYDNKTAFPIIGFNDFKSATDADKAAPAGFPINTAYAGMDSWQKENDPCPAGWRIPTKDEMWALIGGEEAHNKWHYHWYYENQGVYCGSAEAADANQWDTKGCIFMPFAGYRNWEDGVQPEADRVWVQTITRPGQNWQRVCFVFNWTQEMAAANMENNCAFVIRPVADLIEE